MVPSIRRRPHECSSSQFPAQAAWGKGISVPLLVESKLLALGNPPNSRKQGVLCGVGRTIALKRFRSALLSTFLPSPWQQARRGGIWLLGNSYSCKDNSKLWLQISLFPREETEYSSRKKKKKSLSGARRRKWQLLSHQGLFVVTVCTLPGPTLWLPAPFAALMDLFAKHQGASMITDATAFQIEQVYPWGYKDWCGHREFSKSMPDPQLPTHAFLKSTAQTGHLYSRYHSVHGALLSYLPSHKFPSPLLKKWNKIRKPKFLPTEYLTEAGRILRQIPKIPNL